MQQRQLFLVDKARKQEQRIGRVEDVLVNKFAPAINQKANRNEVITQEEADGRYVRQSSEIPEGYKSVNAICEQYFLTYSDNGKKKSKTKFAPQITSAIKNMFKNMSIPSIKHTNWYGNEGSYYHESNYRTIMEALIDGMEYDRTTKSGNKIYVNSEAGIEVTLYPDVDGNVALKPQSTASSLDEFFE
ncbi:hypothetical protein [Vibrio alfacsensis]|uniref:hypothetical protein n=1 Tax=Vibrio alfacsensis TaxID=1074311 RepID=UPI004067B544